MTSTSVATCIGASLPVMRHWIAVVSISAGMKASVARMNPP
jgi:hypothetical protein